MTDPKFIQILGMLEREAQRAIDGYIKDLQHNPLARHPDDLTRHQGMLQEVRRIYRVLDHGAIEDINGFLTRAAMVSRGEPMQAIAYLTIMHEWEIAS